MEYERDIAAHFDSQWIRHVRRGEIVGLRRRSEFMREITPQPSRPIVLIGTTSHKPDIASTEVRAVIVLVAYTLYERHSALIIHGLHRLHGRVQAHLGVGRQSAVERDTLLPGYGDVGAFAIVQVVRVQGDQAVEAVVAAVELKEDEYAVVGALIVKCGQRVVGNHLDGYVRNGERNTDRDRKFL